MKTNKKEVTIFTVCPRCGCLNEVQVNESDYIDWQNGTPTQNAFPYLSAEDREKLISGYCEDCQLALFGEDDDEEDEDIEDEYYAALFGEDDEDDYDDYECEDLDEGFDPYMGCYTEDC